MESDAQLVSSEFPIGVRLGSDQETHWITFTLFFFRNPTVALDVFGIIVMLEKCTTTKGTEWW